METIADRINLVLKERNIKRSAFAASLKIAPSSVTLFCQGKTKPSKQTIALICENYHINESWLITGVGEMEAPVSKEQEIANIASKLMKAPDPFLLRFTSVICDLTEEQLLVIKEICEKVCFPENDDKNIELLVEGNGEIECEKRLVKYAANLTALVENEKENKTIE